MEDDFLQKEDDLVKLTTSRTSSGLEKDATEMSLGQEETKRISEVRLSGTCSNPPSLGVEEKEESLTPGRLSTTNKGDNTRRYPKNTLTQLSDSVQDGQFGKKSQEGMTGSITVGGVKLEEVLKRKRGQEDLYTKKTTNKKTTGKKNLVKTTPSSDRSKQTITRYFAKKTVADEDMKPEDNLGTEDNPIEREKPASLSTRGHMKEGQNCTTDMKSMKLTFGDVKKKSMGDRISRFQDIVDRSAVCVTGSGRCATHNQKLVRRVITKKQSCVDKCGGVGWRLCDFTVMVCPTRLSGAGKAGGDSNTEMSELRRGNATNQITEYLNNIEENQSTAGPVVKRNKTE